MYRYTAVLTEKQVRGLKPREKEYRIGDGKGGGVAGLFMRVHPSGTKSWQVQKATGGKVLGRQKLGEYPAVGLADAREAAVAWLEARSAQRPARGARREVRLGSAEELLDGYVEDMRARGKGSADEVHRQLKRHVYAPLTGLQANEVQAEHISDILRRVFLAGHRVQANRLRSYVHSAWRWGLQYDRDYRTAGGTLRFGIRLNPAADIPRDVEAESTVTRALSWEELGVVGGACDDVLGIGHQLVLRLMLLTGGQRPSEILGLKHAEVRASQRVIELPGSRTKNGLPHLVPLVPEAEYLLEAAAEWTSDGALFFPKQKGSGPRTVQSLWKAVARFTTTVGMEPWTPRDLRRTFKTRGAEVGISKSVRDRLQNHALGDVSSKHYDMWEYLPEKRAALSAWREALADKSGWSLLPSVLE